ncbi:hypothetical protein ACEQ8H_000502 [Pleosporales sp. CAS-2024a]
MRSFPHVSISPWANPQNGAVGTGQKYYTSSASKQPVYRCTVTLPAPTFFHPAVEQVIDDDESGSASTDPAGSADTSTPKPAPDGPVPEVSEAALSPPVAAPQPDASDTESSDSPPAPESPPTNDEEVVEAAVTVVSGDSTVSKGDPAVIEADAGVASEVMISDVKDEPPGRDDGNEGGAVVEIPAEHPLPASVDVAPEPSVVGSEKSGESEQAAQEPPKSPVTKFVHFASDAKDPDAGNSKKKKKLLIGKGKPTAFVRVRDPPSPATSPKDEKNKAIDKIVKKRERRPSFLSLASVDKKPTKIDGRKLTNKDDKKPSNKGGILKSASSESKEEVLEEDDAASVDVTCSVVSEGSVVASMESREDVNEEVALPPPSTSPVDEPTLEPQELIKDESLPPTLPPSEVSEATLVKTQKVIEEVEPALSSSPPLEEAAIENDESVEKGPLEGSGDGTDDSPAEDTPAAASSPPDPPVAEGDPGLLPVIKDDEEQKEAPEEHTDEVVIDTTRTEDAAPTEDAVQRTIAEAQDDASTTAGCEQSASDGGSTGDISSLVAESTPVCSTTDAETEPAVEEPSVKDMAHDEQSAPSDAPNEDEQPTGIESKTDSTLPEAESNSSPSPKASGEDDSTETGDDQADTKDDLSRVEEPAAQNNETAEKVEADQVAVVDAPDDQSDGTANDEASARETVDESLPAVVLEAPIVDEDEGISEASYEEQQPGADFDVEAITEGDTTTESSTRLEFATESPVAEEARVTLDSSEEETLQTEPTTQATNGEQRASEEVFSEDSQTEESGNVEPAAEGVVPEQDVADEGLDAETLEAPIEATAIENSPGPESPNATASVQQAESEAESTPEVETETAETTVSGGHMDKEGSPDVPEPLTEQSEIDAPALSSATDAATETTETTANADDVSSEQYDEESHALSSDIADDSKDAPSDDNPAKTDPATADASLADDDDDPPGAQSEAAPAQSELPELPAAIDEPGADSPTADMDDDGVASAEVSEQQAESITHETPGQPDQEPSDETSTSPTTVQDPITESLDPVSTDTNIEPETEQPAISHVEPVTPAGQDGLAISEAAMADVQADKAVEAKEEALPLESGEEARPLESGDPVTGNVSHDHNEDYEASNGEWDSDKDSHSEVSSMPLSMAEEAAEEISTLPPADPGEKGNDDAETEDDASSITPVDAVVPDSEAKSDVEDAANDPAKTSDPAAEVPAPSEETASNVADPMLDGQVDAETAPAEVNADVTTHEDGVTEDLGEQDENAGEGDVAPSNTEEAASAVVTEPEDPSTEEASPLDETEADEPGTESTQEPGSPEEAADAPEPEATDAKGDEGGPVDDGYVTDQADKVVDARAQAPSATPDASPASASTETPIAEQEPVAPSAAETEEAKGPADAGDAEKAPVESAPPIEESDEDPKPRAEDTNAENSELMQETDVQDAPDLPKDPDLTEPSQEEEVDVAAETSETTPEPQISPNEPAAAVIEDLDEADLSTPLPEPAESDEVPDNALVTGSHTAIACSVEEKLAEETQAQAEEEVDGAAPPSEEEPESTVNADTIQDAVQGPDETPSEPTAEEPAESEPVVPETPVKAEPEQAQDDEEASPESSTNAQENVPVEDAAIAEAQKETESEPLLEASVDAAGEAVPESEQQIAAESEQQIAAEPEQQIAAEPEQQIAAEPEPEPEHEVETLPEAAIESEPEPEPEVSTDKITVPEPEAIPEAAAPEMQVGSTTAAPPNAEEHIKHSEAAPPPDDAAIAAEDAEKPVDEPTEASMASEVQADVSEPTATIPLEDLPIQTSPSAENLEDAPLDRTLEASESKESPPMVAPASVPAVDGPYDDSVPKERDFAIIDGPAAEGPSREKQRRRHSHTHRDGRQRRRESEASMKERPTLGGLPSVFAATKLSSAPKSKRRDSITERDSGRVKERRRDAERANSSSSKERMYSEHRAYRHYDDRGEEPQVRRRNTTEVDETFEEQRRRERRAERKRKEAEEAARILEEEEIRRKEHRKRRLVTKQAEEERLRAEDERHKRKEAERTAREEEERRIRREKRRQKTYEAEKEARRQEIARPEQADRGDEEARRLRRQRRAEREKEKLASARPKEVVEIARESPRKMPRDSARRAYEEDEEVVPAQSSTPHPTAVDTESSPSAPRRRRSTREAPPKRTSMLGGFTLFSRSKAAPATPPTKSSRSTPRVRSDSVEVQEKLTRTLRKDADRPGSSHQSSNESRDRAERPQRDRRQSHGQRRFRNAAEEEEYYRQKEKRRSTRQREHKMSGARDGGVSYTHPIDDLPPPPPEPFEPGSEPVFESEDGPRAVSPFMDDAKAEIGVVSTSSPERRERRRSRRESGQDEYPRTRRITVTERERPVGRRVESDRPRTRGHDEERPHNRRSETERRSSARSSKKKDESGGLKSLFGGLKKTFA